MFDTCHTCTHSLGRQCWYLPCHKVVKPEESRRGQDAIRTHGNHPSSYIFDYVRERKKNVNLKMSCIELDSIHNAAVVSVASLQVDAHILGRSIVYVVGCYE